MNEITQLILHMEQTYIELQDTKQEIENIRSNIVQKSQQLHEQFLEVNQDKQEKLQELHEIEENILKLEKQLNQSIIKQEEINQQDSIYNDLEFEKRKVSHLLESIQSQKQKNIQARLTLTNLNEQVRYQSQEIALLESRLEQLKQRIDQLKQNEKTTQQEIYIEKKNICLQNNCVFKDEEISEKSGASYEHTINDTRSQSVQQGYLLSEEINQSNYMIIRTSDLFY
ncbi:hypothetical protein pb186bvf_018659 [Paramecium bursaria]